MFALALVLIVPTIIGLAYFSHFCEVLIDEYRRK